MSVLKTFSKNMKGILTAFICLSIYNTIAAPDTQRKDDVIYFPDDASVLHLPASSPAANSPELRSSNKPYDPSVISFAWRLFQGSKPANPVNNLVLSPVMIQFLLSILETAAEGQTKDELRQAVGTHDARNFLPLFSPPTRSVKLEAAAGFFVDQSQTLNRKFFDYARSLGTEIALLDFKNRPDETRNNINRWASQATHGKVNELLSPAYDLRHVQVVLASAIYFHSTWRYSFNRTKPEVFYTYTGNGQLYEFMESKQSYVLEHIDLGYGVGGDVIEIPYEGEEYSMLIMVPSANVTLDEFIRNMDVQKFENIIKTLPDKYTRPVTLRMPKFQIVSRFSVVNALLKMGVVDIFTQQSRLPYTGLKDNKISDIIQEATLTVDENGTVASAATASFLIPLSAVQRKELVFTVNKPFLSIILDKTNNVPLFISKIYQPIY